MFHKPFLLSLYCFSFGAIGTFAASPYPIEADEQTLKAAGLGTDAAALIEFFRGKTLDHADRDWIGLLISDLGANEFKVREAASNELVKIGDKAASLLRQAKSGSDAEVARRAEQCLAKIEQQQQPAVTIAAARLLAVRRPEATVQTLLKFAPLADSQSVLDALRDTLAAVAVCDGKPEKTLTDALRSKQAFLRGLAGEALVRAGQGEALPSVRELLDDPDRSVRLRIGLAFVDRNDKTVIPRLIELLGELPRDQAQEIVDLLQQFAQDKSPKVPEEDDESARMKHRDAWRDWWTQNGQRIDLAQFARKPVVVMETSLGAIKIELFPEKAPLTVRNFLQYVKERHYEGLVFHRVIPNFMIQGGGMETGMKERKSRDPIKNESSNGLSNKRGTIAMARTSVPDSAKSQFFINVKDNDFLNKANAPDQAGYCVFGKVVGGMDVVDKIKDVRTGMVGGFRDVPLEEVVIKSVRIVK